MPVMFCPAAMWRVSPVMPDPVAEHRKSAAESTSGF
jgi:hypothetical protein